ncbi:hypothetical protein SAMN06265371_103226 [Lutibacter agarilyticus]|uniref:DUF3820 family protein n=1 Tax=Lutibacter agarilyticus TaxID=1109740 RepID=A0A238WHI0_9FLAO|nr:DUF3820 family protein [Lutibacter agarilyticus]SNR46000.1 hypothetical protein SAMN06265371_103226 [Lutibacter agarilyticus]
MENNQQHLLEILANAKMPYGKFKGKYLIDLPEHYIVWYNNKGFPKGKLGDQLRLVYELQLNGLEDLVRKLRTY